MSDNWLRHVPADPWFRPSAVAAEHAKTLLSSFVPHAEEVTAAFLESVEFIDPGTDWSGVRCPSCGADAESWWEGTVSTAAAAGFSSLSVVAPCCGAAASLNELSYVWPAAFGSFVLEAMNPNVTALSPSQIQELGCVLGCSVREIAQHL